jgi:hypothetical protein
MRSRGLVSDRLGGGARSGAAAVVAVGAFCLWTLCDETGAIEHHDLSAKVQPTLHSLAGWDQSWSHQRIHLAQRRMRTGSTRSSRRGRHRSMTSRPDGTNGPLT